MSSEEEDVIGGGSIWTSQYAAAIWEPLAKHPYCFLIEAIFIALSTWYIIHRKSRVGRPSPLTEDEINELIDDWTPEPLVPPVDPYHFSLRTPEVTSIFGHRIEVDGRNCLNLGTHNYLGLVENPECLQAAIDAVKQYGVGSCGPRGFFGTADIHLKLEEEIAQFLGAEEAILYSYGYSAISSAIPAYAKVTDVIFVDEAVNFAIQQGLTASRSRIHFFAHNDVQHLSRLLEEHCSLERKKKQVSNRFIVVEGLYINRGDICPLPEIIELKHRHKCRLFVDDSCGFGVLGESGRGTLEHFGVDILRDIDMIAASLEYAAAAYGGFCAGSHYIIDHQRLSGLGYCFSASLPPLQAAAALCSIRVLQRDRHQMIDALRRNTALMHQLLSNNQSCIELEGEEISPIKHLRFAQTIDDSLAARPDQLPSSTVEANRDFYDRHRSPLEFDTYRLEKVVSIARENGFALTVARYLTHMEHRTPQPSIRLTVNCALTDAEMRDAAGAIVQAFQTVQQQFCDALI